MDHIGEKLKRLRLAEKITQKELARKVGCTPAYISLLENGRVDPSLSMLKKITATLNITIVDFFRPDTEEKTIVRKKDREVVEFPKSKMSIQMLVANPRSKSMDARIATIYPGGGSRGPYQHDGEEFGVVLQGKLELIFDGTVTYLDEGDSFYFSSTNSHQFRNPGDTNTLVLWVNNPPSF